MDNIQKEYMVTIMYLEKIMHKRFKEIKDITEYIVNMENVNKVDLFEDKEMEISCDNALIGTIYLQENDNEVQYDIQIWYIKDNLGQYYITEVECLGELI